MATTDRSDTRDAAPEPFAGSFAAKQLEKMRRTGLAQGFGAADGMAVLDEFERLKTPLREIAVDVVLADDLSPETQLAALWQVVRRHTEIAKEALRERQP